MKRSKDAEARKILFKMVSLGRKADKGVIPITASMYRAARKKVSIECWRARHGVEGVLRYMHPSMQDTYVQFNNEDKSILVCAPGERTVFSIASRLGLRSTIGNY